MINEIETMLHKAAKELGLKLKFLLYIDELERYRDSLVAFFNFNDVYYRSSLPMVVMVESPPHDFAMYLNIPYTILPFFDVVMITRSRKMVFAQNFEYNIVAVALPCLDEHVEYLKKLARLANLIKNRVIKVRAFLGETIRNNIAILEYRSSYTESNEESSDEPRVLLSFSFDSLNITVKDYGDSIEVDAKGEIIRRSRCIADASEGVFRVAPMEFEVYIKDPLIVLKRHENRIVLSDVYLGDALIRTRDTEYNHPNVHPETFAVCLGDLRLTYDVNKDIEEIARDALRAVIELLSCPSTSAFDSAFFDDIGNVRDLPIYSSDWI